MSYKRREGRKEEIQEGRRETNNMIFFLNVDTVYVRLVIIESLQQNPTPKKKLHCEI